MFLNTKSFPHKGEESSRLFIELNAFLFAAEEVFNMIVVNDFFLKTV